MFLGRRDGRGLALASGSSYDGGIDVYSEPGPLVGDCTGYTWRCHCLITLVASRVSLRFIGAGLLNLSASVSDRGD